MANAARSNLAILRARSRGQRYIPASAMANTLTDPAKLFLIIPPHGVLTQGAILRPQVGAVSAVGLYELPPAQAPLGILSQKGTANAIPGWIDGFAVVPTSIPVAAGGAVLNAQLQEQIANLLSFGRIVWKGDEQILRTIYFGDAQRREMASFLQTPFSGGDGGGGAGFSQAACGAPGQPVYQTPGYCWTGRSAADFYVEYMGPEITNGNDTNLEVAIYVYGQYILNVDPLQQVTADTVRGGTDGPQAGNCENDATNALEQRNAQAREAAAAVARTGAMMREQQGPAVKTCSR